LLAILNILQTYGLVYHRTRMVLRVFIGDPRRFLGDNTTDLLSIEPDVGILSVCIAVSICQGLSLMNAELNLLQAGISAIHKQQYAQAVEALEAFCRNNTGLKPNEYFEAQRWLIKAYQRNGQVDLAIYLCRQMADSPDPQTRRWAKSNLEWLEEESGTVADRPTISPNSSTPSVPAMPQGERATIENFIPLTSASLALSSDPPDLGEIQGNVDPAQLLSPEEVAKRLQAGQKALKMGRFEEAIEQLELLCHGVESTHKDFAQAQMSLVKAYNGGGKPDWAIALCRHLTTSQKEYVQIWATQFLLKLTPANDVDAESASAELKI
jgi:tetratricopeptide (TPR) repeat protein